MLLTSLRPYQWQAVEASRGFDGFAIFPEPRTGKTLVALAIVNERRPSAVLVVCPCMAIREWDEQSDKHIRAEWPCTLRIVNYEELIRRRKEIKAWLKRWPREEVMMILDESHRIKRRGAQASMVCRNLGKRYAKHRLVMTGTPIAQGLQDAWAQMSFVDPELFGSWEDFDERYLRWGGFRKLKIVGYKNQEEFEHKFHSRSVRLTLNEVREKPVRVRKVKHTFDLRPSTQKVYQELETKLEAEVNQKKIKLKAVMTAALKCQQVTGGFVLDDTGVPEPVGSEKIECFLKLLRGELRERKFVVVARFRHELEKLTQLIEAEGLTCKTVAGGLPYDGKFDTDAIVMQVQSGISVDMAQASVLVFYSYDYSLLTFVQARFRILSYDTPQVTYHYLIANSTVDALLYTSVTKKKKFSDVVCDHYRWRKNSGQSRKAA